jgi:hypothetical protein
VEYELAAAAGLPLFMRNVLYTLGDVADAAGEERTQPGEVKPLRPDAAVPRSR